MEEATELEQRYKDEIKDKNLKANAIQACNVEQIPGIENEIPPIQAKIAELMIFRSTKYASYWVQHEQDQTELLAK